MLSGPPPSLSDPLPVGASLDQIQRFSKMYKYIKVEDVPENEKERCTICLMDFEADEDVRCLCCTHVFHVTCIDRWLVYNKKCPVCRIDLDKADIPS
ncbi:unnamed protein product [Dracunculus medinensis]|uniref:RING-type E3 ubiquitin transferase n=1 Tax=Dracunculus medinensis TaxID=318479 RepID=A0A0N4UAI3_DRAME|nr:unnamed protein product [Dracunculus medinensis]